MNKLTYKESYDLIIDAYFKDEIKPFNARFCICGTLSGGAEWGISGYTDAQLGRMEFALLQCFPGIRYLSLRSVKAINFEFVLEYEQSLPFDLYESYIFAGMCAALDVLKQIHIERGEFVNEPVLPFTKRELVK